jgi:outer membrane receptor protein involved in Fe transport
MRLIGNAYNYKHYFMKISTATKGCLTALVFCFYYSAFAQNGVTSTAGNSRDNVRASIKTGTITGVVLDKSTSRPVEYANISIFKDKDSSLVTGGITDQKGRFSIEKIPYGLFTVKIRFIGYSMSVRKGIKVSQSVNDVGTIEITPSSKSIGEVTVVGRKSEIQNNLDKKVFNIDRTMYGTGGTALDIMQSLPAVQVDFDGNVSMRGSSVTILIDGRPSNLVSLDQMPANLIEKVEVISNPSAKYDPEGVSGIINIVLKKNVQRGLNGMVTLNAGWNSKWMGNAALNYRKNKVNLFANYTLRSFHGDSYQDFWSEKVKNGERNYQEKNTTSTGNFRMQNIQFGVDYYINSKNTISTSITLEPRKMDGDDYTLGFFKEMSSSLTEYKPSYNYTKEGWNSNTNKGGFEYDLNYKKAFEKEGAELTAELNVDRGNMESKQGALENYIDLLPTITTGLDKMPRYINQVISNTNDNTRSFVRTDLTLPVATKGRIETGYMLSHSFSKMRYDLSRTTDITLPIKPLPEYDNDFDYRQIVNALYAIYAQSIGNFKMQLGLRGEHTDAHGDQKTQNSSFTKKYMDFFPSFFVKYSPNEHDEIGVNYSRRINRPRTWALNPFENKVDELNISKGNPDLNPEYVNSFEIGYTKLVNRNSFAITGFYRRTTGVITSVRTWTDNLHSITSYLNLNSSESYGAEASSNVNLLKWWNMNANYSYFHTKLSEKESSILTDKTRESDSWTLRATSNWFITKSFSFQLMYNHRSPVVSTGGGGYRGMGGGTQGKTRTNYYFDMGSRYTFLKGKADVSLRVSDIFNTNKYTQDGFGDGYTSYTKSWRETPNIFLGFSYKINDYKRKTQQRQDSDTDDMMQ